MPSKFQGPMHLHPQIFEMFRNPNLKNDINDYQSALYAAVNYFYCNYGIRYDDYWKKKRPDAALPFTRQQFKETIMEFL